MSILDNNYTTIEEFKMYLFKHHIMLGRTDDGLICDVKMIDDTPTLTIRADVIAGGRYSTHINLCKYGVRRLLQDGYAIKIEYNPLYSYGFLSIKVAMNGLTPTDFQKLFEGIPINLLVINMSGVFDCSLKEYFTKKMIVDMLTITDDNPIARELSDPPGCNLKIPSEFWKICPKLTIENMKSTKLSGGVDGYKSLTIYSSKK